MKVYNIEEITNSNIMYKRNPPRFMFYIISIISIILLGFIVWSCYATKTFIIKGQGVVSRANKLNIMSKISGEIKEIYIKEGQQVKAGDVLLVFNATEPDIQISQGEEQLKYLNRRIEFLKRAEKEVEDGINTFNKNHEEEKDFYNRIRSFELKTKEYIIDEKSMKKQGYSDEEIIEYKKQGKNKIEVLRYETIVGLENEKESLETEKIRLKGQTRALKKTLNEYKLFALADGEVHLNSPLNKGMVLQGGTLLGTISNENDEIIIDAAISSIDRPRISEGSEVSLVVGGLNQAEYGTIDGQIMSIESDATIDKEKGNIYFNIKIRPVQSYLKDKKGNRVDLTEGMVTETRVKYEKISYMKYFLEQIGIKFN